jgi:hypothetical protein
MLLYYIAAITAFCQFSGIGRHVHRGQELWLHKTRLFGRGQDEWAESVVLHPCLLKWRLPQCAIQSHHRYRCMLA